MSSLEILQSRSQIIETFLGRQFPLHKIFEALAASMPDVYFDALNKSKATVQVQRQSLDVLTDAELNRITTSGVLTIGSTTHTGTIQTITGARFVLAGAGIILAPLVDQSMCTV